MKNFVKIALSTTAIFALSANAALSFGSEQSEAYVGAKISNLQSSKASDSLLGYGVYGGYNLNQNLGIEAEYMGSNTKKIFGLDAKVTSFGAYGTYRYHFEGSPFYAKAKLGAARSVSSITAKPAAPAASGSSTTPAAVTLKAEPKIGIAGGVGVGYKTGNLGAELSYNRLTDDVNVASLGVNIAF